MTVPTETLPPVRRSIAVSWDQEAAFRRFTADFAKWWPSGSHSIGRKRVKELVFECRVGGRIFEEMLDGRRFQWGTVTKWDPPRAVGFTWHPASDAALAQDVEVIFTPVGSGTHVELICTGWERLGANATRARKGYDLGWGSVLDTFAEKWSATMLFFQITVVLATGFAKITGKLEHEINNAGGRMPDRA